MNGRLLVDHTYRRTYREMVVTLASELFRRERGSDPPSDEALVGSYLKELPDDASADLPDPTTPAVD
jgi:hypothetical protein